MHSRFLIYGATGYTGKLIARTARQRNLPAIVAGRDATRVAALARRLGLEGRVFELDDPGRIEEGLRGVDFVINAAGPFSATAEPIVGACLRVGTHYLDVAGEIDVFSKLRSRSDAAQLRGVMLMPGVGINVVASDCLAAYVKKRLPTANRLAIGISRTPFISQGSLRTLSALVGGDIPVCRDRELGYVALGSLGREFDFGVGPKTSTGAAWPDVLTASVTTGIPNVEAYLQIEPSQRPLLPLARAVTGMWNTALGRMLLKADAMLLPDGPSYEDQKTRRRAVVVEAADPQGAKVGARLRTPEGYWFTTLSALRIAERLLAGEFFPGFQTPAAVYGADLVLELEGVSRDDLYGQHG